MKPDHTYKNIQVIPSTNNLAIDPIFVLSIFITRYTVTADLFAHVDQKSFKFVPKIVYTELQL